MCGDGVTYVKNFSAASCWADCLVRHSQNSCESPERGRKSPEVTQKVNGNVGIGLGILLELFDEIKERKRISEFPFHRIFSSPFSAE